MGLDVYASRTPHLKDDHERLTQEDIEAFQKTDAFLTRGLFSFGAGAFRGKVYAPIVYRITGVDLYQKWIPPDVVKKMWESLERCDSEKLVEEDPIICSTTSVILELQRFFQVCAERNLGLIGWW